MPVRTTLDLDEDVLAAAAELARRRGVPLGRVVSDLLRQALVGQPAAGFRNGVPLFPVQPGAGVVTPEIVERLGG